MKRWNIAAAVVHGGAAIATLFLKDSKVQMYRSEYGDDVPLSKIDIPAKLVPKKQVSIKQLIFLFFLVTCLFHIFYALDIGYSKALNGVGWNPYRWVEYSISAAFMIYVISAVSGTKDSVSAIAAALITPSLMINGFTTEKELQQNALSLWSQGLGPKPMQDSAIIWSNFGPAWALFGVQWYIILSNYFKLVGQAKEAGNPIEKPVQFAVISQLFFFSLFGVVQSYQVWQWFKGVGVQPMFIVYEKIYIVLSAVTKLLLAGTLASVL